MLHDDVMVLQVVELRESVTLHVDIIEQDEAGPLRNHKVESIVIYKATWDCIEYSDSSLCYIVMIYYTKYSRALGERRRVLHKRFCIAATFARCPFG